MSVDISRKQFLRGHFREPSQVGIGLTNVDPSGIASSEEVSAIGIHINSLCLSVAGTTCRLCEDECNRQAIDFRLMTAGRSLPIINDDDCNGCQDCASVCPVGAIHPVYAPIPDKETLT